MFFTTNLLLFIVLTIVAGINKFSETENLPVSGRITSDRLVCPEPPRFGESLSAEITNDVQPHKEIDVNWQNSVLEKIKAEEYNISIDEFTGEYNSPNRKNNILFKYEKNGFTAKNLLTKIPKFDESNRTLAESEKEYETVDEWEVKLKIENEKLEIEDERLQAAGNKIWIENENIRIDYTNSEDGMRQDFIIKQKPTEEGKLKLDLSAETELKMIVGADALMFKNEEGEEMMKYSALKVWDANGKILRAYFQNEKQKLTSNSPANTGRQFSIVVNDEEAVYPITIDPLSTSPNWVVTLGYSFGSASSAAGDVNGDGYGDVIVGAKETTTNFTNDGKVYLFLGSSTGLSTSPAWSSTGANENSAQGNSISTAGDVNGDGYSDVIIGEPGYKVAGVSRGRALVYLGSPSGLSTSPNWSVIGTTTDLGRAVSTAGDVNGDGYSDVIVSTAYGTIDSANILGGAYLYLGSSSGLSSTPAWRARGTKYFENYGNSVCTAGDINGDGYSDIVIGAPQYSINSSSNEGAVYGFYGSSTGLASTPDWFVTGPQSGYKFGYAVYTAGDVNGDGYSDVVIGAPDSGKAFVFHGSASGLSQTQNWVAAGAAGSGFGFSVSTAGDIDGDGFSEILVGAPGGSGQAFAYSGSPSGLSANNVWSVSNDGSTIALGFTVCIAGDVNGDGYSDALISGYSPKAFVYNGSPSGFNSTNSWTYAGGGGSFGWSVASAGDINGDGYSDVIIGAPDYNNGAATVGKFFIFHGSANNLPSIPSFVKTGTNSGASIYRIGRCVASAGDVNSDGYSDVAVGITTGVFGVSEFGGVEIYYGSPTGISSTASWTKSSEVSGDKFGTSVATAGDVNGDGYSDILVGAWGLNSFSGAAYSFYGSENGLSSNANWSAAGPSASWFGYSVSSAGDVNGDGYADVVVGAPNDSYFGSPNGSAFVYHGSSSGLSNSAAWQWTESSYRPKFGTSVACAGDVNGDGYSDVLIGLNKYYLFPREVGAAACFYGSSTGLNPLYPEWFVEAPVQSFSHEFGGCVSSAGDVNGDGYSDVIVSAPYPFGNVYCYYGSSNGLPLSFSANYGNAPTLRFGSSAASAGDVNGDGYSDIIIGAYFSSGGHAFLYNGNSSSGKSTFVNQYKPSSNELIGTGGWSEANGQVKYGIFGRSPFGRADGKIVYEHKIRGNSFSPLTNTSGSGSGAVLQDFGINGTIVNSNVSGLNQNKEYHWRARLQYSQVNNPYQKLGPWRFYNSQYPLPFEGFKPKEVPVIPLVPAYALNFDGSNDYVTLPDSLTSSLTGGNGITVEYKFKGTDVKSAIRLQNSNGFIISGHNGKHVISTDGGLDSGIQIGGSVTDGEWHHVSFTWERNKPDGFRSYLDGILVDQRNSADVNLPLLTSGGTLGGSITSGEYMNGSLDEVRLWNRAMSNEEIEYRAFCILNGRIPGLLANYHFDQGYVNHNNSSETILHDSSTYSYNGTLNNFALQGSSSNWTSSDAFGFSCIGVPTMELDVIQEGFYNTSDRLNMRDTVTVYLHSSTSPYAKVDSARSVIDSLTFKGTFSFRNSSPGYFYFSVKHRNCIETWSSYDEYFTSWTPLLYSMTFGSYSAYGNNLKYLAQFRYGMYSGDVNQDGTVDATDVSTIDNDVSNFIIGYVVTDLTGDEFVDATDFAIADNNAGNFVSVVRP
jgi:hypothetical protein